MTVVNLKVEQAIREAAALPRLTPEALRNVVDAMRQAEAQLPSPLNNALPVDTTVHPDGVALHSTVHPVQISEAMFMAGSAALSNWSYREADDQELRREKLRDIFEAMYHAMPILPEIRDDSITTGTVEYYLPDDVVEKLAADASIQVPADQPPRTWEEQPEPMKHFWRRFVRTLAEHVRHAHKLRFIEDDLK